MDEAGQPGITAIMARRSGPGIETARPALPIGAGNLNLGSLSPQAQAQVGGRHSPLPLRVQMDALYQDAIVVSDAARRWFDGPGRMWRAQLPPQPALAAALECLEITTRLLAVMNWLLDPAHEVDDPVLLPLPCPLPPPLPAGHPMLADTGGFPIAQASRDVLARAHELALSCGEQN